MKNKYAAIGIIIGCIALVCAIFSEEIATLVDKLKPEQSVIEKIIDKGKRALTLEENISKSSLNITRLIYMIGGSIGLLFSIFSFVQKEETRMSIISSAVSIAALAWAYVLLGIVIAVVLMILWTFREGLASM